MTYRNLIAIRQGLNKLNGLPGLELGILRAKIGSEIDPIIEKAQEWMFSPEFQAAQEEFAEMEQTPENLAAYKEKHKALFDKRRKQAEEYNQLLDREAPKLNLPKIPKSILPKNIDNSAVEDLYLLIDLKK